MEKESYSISFLRNILEQDCQLPKTLTAMEMTPFLISNLGATDSELRETSYRVFSGLIIGSMRVTVKF